MGTSMGSIAAEGREQYEEYLAERVEVLAQARRVARLASVPTGDLVHQDVDSQLGVIGYRMQRAAVMRAAELRELVVDLESLVAAGVRVEALKPPDVERLDEAAKTLRLQVVRSGWCRVEEIGGT